MLIINGRFLSQRMTGVHRYAYEMTKALYSLGVPFVVVAPRSVQNSYETVFKVEYTGVSSSHYWEQFELPAYVKRHYKGSTILSFTGLGPIHYKKSVVTIHDLSFMENPKWFSVPYYCFYRLLTPVAARNARLIITVSEFSKQEIIQRLGISDNLIAVAYNAVSSECVKPVASSKAENDVPYLLTVSSLDPRKNLKRLIEAFMEVDEPDCHLKIVGATHASFRNSGIDDSADKRIQLLGYVDNERLKDLYGNAIASVYPSLYEGFGLPNIEAMANDCPVLTSMIPPHREVCGDSALFFDPNDKTDMTFKMTQIIKDVNLQNQLRQSGHQRVQLFSWERSARMVLKSLKDKELI